MGLIFNAASALSRKIRSNFVKGKTGKALLSGALALPGSGSGIRKIGKLTKLQPDSNPIADIFNNPFFGVIKAGLSAIQRYVFNPIAGFVGWGFSKLLSFVGASASEIWSLVVQSAQAIWRFDWNATDEALKQMIDGQYLGLAGIWGGFVGQGLGWFAGIGIGYGISFLCPVIGGAGLARLVASKAALEAGQELGASFGNAMRATAGALVNNALISGYINYRKFIKKLPDNAIKTLFGEDSVNFIKNVWGANGAPNMSFSTQVEEAVEKIDNKYIKTFVENLLEESWDSFTEAGFVIAAEIDNAYQQNKLGNDRQMGTERSLVVMPDSRAKGEILTFSALPQKQMIASVEQTLNTHRLIHNRDVGMVIGQPVDDYVRARPQTLRLVIRLFSEKEPPYRAKGNKKLIGVTVTIPDVNRSKVNWDAIKLACGGATGYNWGRFRATANLDNGRQMAVYGASEQEAETRLKAFLALSSAKLITLSINEEKKQGRRLETPKLYKETTRIYPAFFTIINREQILDPLKGDASLKENYFDKKARIDLWGDTEPKYAKETINRLFVRGS